MRISDWSSDVCSSDLDLVCRRARCRLMFASTQEDTLSRNSSQKARKCCRIKSSVSIYVLSEAVDSPDIGCRALRSSATYLGRTHLMVPTASRVSAIRGGG